MTPSQRARYGCEAARDAKWRVSAPANIPFLKRPGGIPQPWPIHPHLRDKPTSPTYYPLLLLTCLFSTPDMQRRVPSGPIWSPSSAPAVKGVCDFFRGEAAFLALGKARPELSSVQEALEELFPDHLHYRADLLRAWEKRLSPAPDKAAKADSGYSEGADSISKKEEKSLAQLQPLKPLPDVGPAQKGVQQRMTFDLPSDGSDVTLSDIERCYEIGRTVGDGNFAVVRECRRRDNGQTLAIKIVERSKLIGREHMMQNELSLLGSLCHPRIVRLVAHHHTHTHSYLVMELVSGGDLFEAISERGKFSEAEAGLMVSDMSEALNYIHCKSIVHRDLKPENLLVIERVAADICRLKLGDFGLAMVVTEPVFTICGTPTYVAPEILCETGYGVAVDIWALGVILYILLCGFPPFRSRDRDQEELFQLIKQGQLHFLSPYWDPISEEARGLVRALLQADPTVRLTAEQTLLHPWVKAMASNCRQRTLTDKTLRNTADTGAEAEGVQSPAQTNAAETMADKRPGHTSCEEEITQKQFSRTDEKQTGMNTGRGQDEDRAPRQQSKETRTVHAISTQVKADKMAEDTPGQQKPECTSPGAGSHNRDPSRQEIQDPGLKQLSNTNWELNQPDATEHQTEFPSQIKT
ncbi:hypothetical protein INR49_023538 [Caranx melampygus]|nr:hypothetical protein INR49_023538 [Caranx melampygus]